MVSVMTHDKETRGFYSKAAEPLMLNQKERILIKLLLEKAMKSRIARELIREKLGADYLSCGESLLKAIRGD
jgi:hypothetical protein